MDTGRPASSQNIELNPPGFRVSSPSVSRRTPVRQPDQPLNVDTWRILLRQLSSSSLMLLLRAVSAMYGNVDGVDKTIAVRFVCDSY
jgi:hypothetical protein